jgi:hypothetical protein
MLKIIKPRGGGKTTELIKISATNWYYIVCSSFKECTFISDQAIKMGLEIPFPITVEEMLNSRNSNIRGFLIDNVELFLHQLSPNTPVIGFTIGSEGCVGNCEKNTCNSI